MLNKKQVKQIRKNKYSSYDWLAYCYGVTERTIKRIKTRKTWATLK